jgi:hypothetical protein
MAMELIQIGTPATKPLLTVREMFERLAQREAEMIRAAHRRAELHPRRGHRRHASDVERMPNR